MWKEIYPLLEQHWAEIAHYKDIPLAPDVDFYHRADDMGMVRVFTARDVATETKPLVGYSVYFIRPNFHYKQVSQAQQDILFIKPSHRGRFGKKFIEWCDEQLKSDGVQMVVHHVKAAHDFSPLLVRLGYELVDKLYCRRFY